MCFSSTSSAPGRRQAERAPHAAPCRRTGHPAGAFGAEERSGTQAPGTPARQRRDKQPLADTPGLVLRRGPRGQPARDGPSGTRAPVAEQEQGAAAPGPAGRRGAHLPACGENLRALLGTRWRGGARHRPRRDGGARRHSQRHARVERGGRAPKQDHQQAARAAPGRAKREALPTPEQGRRRAQGSTVATSIQSEGPAPSEPEAPGRLHAAVGEDGAALRKRRSVEAHRARRGLRVRYTRCAPPRSPRRRLPARAAVAGEPARGRHAPRRGEVPVLRHAERDARDRARRPEEPRRHRRTDESGRGLPKLQRREEATVARELAR